MNIRRIAEILAIALTMVLVVGAGGAPIQVAYAAGAWLDAPLQNWNKPGQAVPLPPPVTNPAEIDERCLQTIRPAESSEDAQVEQQGWFLVGTYTGGWHARVIQGTTSFDGMCRPVGFQTFVFSDGTFAGTLSPLPMYSRTDGALNTLFVTGPDSPSGLPGISAHFARYTPDDALCCPAATSTLTFQMMVHNDQPLLMPMRVYTNPRTQQ